MMFYDWWHSVKRTKRCPYHGGVTRFYMCSKYGPDPKFKGPPVVAKSKWMEAVA